MGLGDATVAGIVDCSVVPARALLSPPPLTSAIRLSATLVATNGATDETGDVCLSAEEGVRFSCRMGDEVVTAGWAGAANVVLLALSSTLQNCFGCELTDDTTGGLLMTLCSSE